MKNPNEIVLSLFAKNHGYLLSRELSQKSSLFVELRKLLDNGIVLKIKPGLYKHNDFPPQNELIEVAKMYPQGVFCLFSAWSYYELTDQVSYLHHMAFPNKAKVKLLDYPPLKPYFWSYQLLCLHQIQLAGFKMYSLERSVCDAIKFRNKIGIDTMAELLKNYLKRNDKDLNLLFRVAKQMKMENLLRDYLNLIV